MHRAESRSVNHGDKPAWNRAGARNPQDVVGRLFEGFMTRLVCPRCPARPSMLLPSARGYAQFIPSGPT